MVPLLLLLDKIRHAVIAGAVRILSRVCRLYPSLQASQGLPRGRLPLLQRQRMRMVG